MGPEYVSDLTNMNTLRELNQKLPNFGEQSGLKDAGKIFESGLRPRFEDFIKFIKKKEILMNNEFHDDLSSNSVKESDKGNFSGNDNSRSRGKISFTGGTGIELNGQSKNPSRNDEEKQKTGQRGCSLCKRIHGMWKCDKFQALSQPEEKKVMSGKGALLQVAWSWSSCTDLFKEIFSVSDSKVWKGTSHVVTPRAFIYREGKRAHKALIDV